MRARVEAMQKVIWKSDVDATGSERGMAGPVVFALILLGVALVLVAAVALKLKRQPMQ